MTTTIIAEAGVNHNGSLVRAKKMIKVASEMGADYIKFQTFKADSLVLKNADKANYQLKSTNSNESHYEMIKKLEIDEDFHLELIKHCKKNCIKFLSTAFDIESVDLLDKLKIPFYKIPSGEITNFPYLNHIGSKKKPIILSTGMSSLEEIKSAVNILIKAGLNKKFITVLHCNTEYPTPMYDVNLNAMISIKRELDVNVGYSDHTKGIEVSIAAVALGATVIEKHFTLDCNMQGPDHRASLEPNEFKNMIKSIRNIELSMGNGIKKPSASEIKNIFIARKSIVSKKDIKKGEIYSISNLTTKRPGTGICASKWYEYIGKKSNKDYKIDELINE
tara:strand:- start:322 stop:1323 length:1002 start_codon:yes stop_codon:yes gene_type:complete